MEKAVYQLKITPAFKNLVQPIRKPALRKLSQELENKGCLAPLSVWQMHLLVEFDQYEICNNKQIPFTYRIVDFSCQEAAIVWICQNQLSRNDLTEEWRKYLIGMQFGAERIAIVKDRQLSQSDQADAEDGETISLQGNPPRPPSARSVAIRIGEANHIAWNTVVKYAEYAKQIERLRDKNSSIVASILLGDMRVSHNMLSELCGKPDNELADLFRRIKKSGAGRSNYKTMRAIIVEQKFLEEVKTNGPSTPSVKDMPAYDPDAEAVALTYTVPSWGDSIRRVSEKVNFCLVSNRAKVKLLQTLFDLMQEISVLLDKVRDGE